MKYSIGILLSLIVMSCNTVKIKDRDYKISSTTTEIGSVGFSKSAITKNDFNIHVFPILENKIRVEVSIVPFTKGLYKTYYNRAKFDQNQAKIQYSDSLETKPELIVISLLDIAGFVNEINSHSNKEVVDFLKNTQKAKIITSIVTTLSEENISKIKLADSYYLVNNQDSKYTLALYKANKKMEIIDLQSGVVLGYEVSKCCWTMNNKGKWHLADLINENAACKGITDPKIKERKSSESLYRM